MSGEVLLYLCMVLLTPPLCLVLLLFFFHPNTRYCVHRSHLLHLPCRREAVYDGFCTRHNDRCWSRHG